MSDDRAPDSTGDTEIGRAGVGAQVKERGVLEHAARVVEFAREQGFVIAYANLALNDAAYPTPSSWRPGCKRCVPWASGARTPRRSDLQRDHAACRRASRDKTGIDPLVGEPLCCLH